MIYYDDSVSCVQSPSGATPSSDMDVSAPVPTSSGELDSPSPASTPTSDLESPSTATPTSDLDSPSSTPSSDIDSSTPDSTPSSYETSDITPIPSLDCSVLNCEHHCSTEGLIPVCTCSEGFELYHVNQCQGMRVRGRGKVGQCG